VKCTVTGVSELHSLYYLEAVEMGRFRPQAVQFKLTFSLCQNSKSSRPSSTMSQQQLPLLSSPEEKEPDQESDLGNSYRGHNNELFIRLKLLLPWILHGLIILSYSSYFFILVPSEQVERSWPSTSILQPITSKF
jgi:hypothetical protein